MNERDLLRDQLIHHQCVPIVLSGLISGWAAASWTPQSLTEVLGDRSLQFRIGNLTSAEVQWENKCDYINASVGELTEWVSGECSAGNALLNYDRKTHSCYADYKYMAELFEDQPQFLNAVDWSVLGFEDRDGRQSTFWLGSQGASTVCHYDTYGCNVVAQIYGRKRWILFAPSDTKYMYPTRIPYEESSVFSRVSISTPDLDQFPEFKHVTPYVVTLEPGDVLFVPPKWWHFVESLEPSISINSWIEMASDDSERLREAVTRTMAFMLMSESDAPISSWLNPTEDFTDRVQNTEYIRLTLSTVLERDLADNFLKRTNPVSPHRKRPRENSPSDNVEGQTSKFPGARDKADDHVDSVESEKAFDIVTLCKNLGGEVREIGACSWIEYCRMFQNDKGQSTPCIQMTDCRVKDDATGSDLRKSFGVSKTEGIVSVAHPNHVSTSLQISSTDPCSSESSCGCFHDLTSSDLSDVLLDPEVIDLMCQKLIRKFQIRT